jgi:hypothetical protein
MIVYCEPLIKVIIADFLAMSKIALELMLRREYIDPEGIR